ncbi:M24 family metallopeptidase, partial [Mesorhizobium sp. M7A.F.Ca.ET.027.03.2.1]
MPGRDFDRLKLEIGGIEFIDATSLVRTLRIAKSEAEIAKMAYIGSIASDSFEAVVTADIIGVPEREIARQIKIDLLQRGADQVHDVQILSGAGGYGEVIGALGDRLIQQGDVIFIDIGATFDGYWCDFDRVYAVSEASKATTAAYARAYEATEAGMATALPGNNVSDIWRAMSQVMGTTESKVGRIGHGLGLQNTEWPSIMETDTTAIVEGMVLC